MPWYIYSPAVEIILLMGCLIEKSLAESLSEEIPDLTQKTDYLCPKRVSSEWAPIAIQKYPLCGHRRELQKVYRKRGFKD